MIVPPTGYDPDTGADLDEFVEVGTSGVVTTWSWQPKPAANNPLDRPFAWALIQLDGADTGLLHAVDAGSPEKIEVGARVKVRWQDERVGHINDIECFELEQS